MAGQRERFACRQPGHHHGGIGQDGGSPFRWPHWFAALEAKPVAINLASYAGHNTLREKVLGSDANRPASAAEIEAWGPCCKRN